MKITITIDCDDVDEIYTHLSVIRSQIKKKVKTLPENEKWPTFTLEDANCYGAHIVIVEDDIRLCKG